MFDKIVEGLWFRPSRQVGRRRHQQKPERADLSHAETGIFETPDPKHDFKAFLDQVDVSVRKAELEFDFRIQMHEFGKDGIPGIAHERRTDAKSALRTIAGDGEIRFGGCNLVHDRATSDEEAGALRREADAACVSVKEANSELFFEAGDRLAN